jgi:NTP pyrophosphatase (non-canonical NTP hydrolase)
MKDKLKLMCEQAIKKWGTDVQAQVAVEELLECALEIIRFTTRGRGSVEIIAREIADVEICITQLKLMIGEDICQKALEEKLLKFQQHLLR